MKILGYEKTWPRSSSFYTRGPRTEMSRTGIAPEPPRWDWEASTLDRKEPFEQLVYSYSEYPQYIWARDQWRMLATRTKLTNYISKYGLPLVLEFLKGSWDVVIASSHAFVFYRRLSPQFQFSLSGVTLVYLSQCPPLPPAFGLIYEGAIGQPRYVDDISL
jgi:hypothetical protein